ncbi:MAG: coenzyme F420 hydrogenase beta subunit [Methanolobus sp. T82-4]|nr:MAG: coenzyme F420 hydrogenase beta subunit [Methanolobus sp. T82-4]
MTKSFRDINLDLCTYCGTCVGICPSNAIVSKNESVYLEGNCIGCGLCYKACPGIKVDFQSLNSYIFQKDSYDPSFGYFKKQYIAHSVEENIRSNASSGGVVTTLLIYLIENKLVDGVVVTGMDPERPWHYKVKIARTKDEICNAIQSKYSLVPVNEILKEITENEGDFAFVGLPCHIHAIRTLQKDKWSNANKIKYLIGLFCGFNMSIDATCDLISKHKLSQEQIKELKYRGGGHPGGFTISANSKTLSLNKFYYNILNLIYVPDRCLMCTDLFNELADISVGDIWKKRVEGAWSSVIVRSEIGDKLLSGALENNYLKCASIEKSELYNSHRHLIKHKKQYLAVRLKLREVKPLYSLKVPSLKASDYFYGSFFYVLFFVSTSRFTKAIFKFTPLSLIGFASKSINLLIRK